MSDNDERWAAFRASARGTMGMHGRAFFAWWDALTAEGPVPYPRVEPLSEGDGLRASWSNEQFYFDAEWDFAANFEAGLIPRAMGGESRMFEDEAESIAVLRPLLLALHPPPKEAA